MMCTDVGKKFWDDSWIRSSKILWKNCTRAAHMVSKVIICKMYDKNSLCYCCCIYLPQGTRELKRNQLQKALQKEKEVRFVLIQISPYYCGQVAMIPRCSFESIQLMDRPFQFFSRNWRKKEKKSGHLSADIKILEKVG